MKMKVKRRRGALWIFGREDGAVGPYDDSKAGRAEAREDIRSMELFDENCDKPMWITADKRKREKRR